MRCDIAIVGGGLSGSMAAAALCRKRPDLDIILIEEQPALGANGCWSFYGLDIGRSGRWLVAPLVGNGWRGYDVRFTDYERHIGTILYTIMGERLDEYMRQLMPSGSLLLGERALALSQTNVLLSSGRRIEAHGVIDARGPGDLGQLRYGWMKYGAMLLHLDAPHGQDYPLLLDCQQDQAAGLHFHWALPVSPTDILLRDVVYSDDPTLDIARITSNIVHYAQGRGWQAEQISQSDARCQPVVTGGDLAAYWQSTGGDLAKIGRRAGLFHPLSANSLPDAVAMASSLVGLEQVDGATLARHCRRYGLAQWQARRYYRKLASLIFTAGDADTRYRLAQYFYKLPEKTIHRHLSTRAGPLDRLRILSGRPPVAIGDMVRTFLF